MEQFKLNDGTILNIVPMGIGDNTIAKTRTVMFQTTLTYAEIETILLNSTNLSVTQHLSETGEVYNTYTDIAKLKNLGYDYNSNTYTAVFSTDEVEAKLQSITTQLDDLTNVIIVISMK
jgi:molybdopterin-guanine dinucleotide biosynthesis protein